MARYRVLSEWQADAPLEDVWSAILRYRDWPTWWRGFESVEPIAPGDDAGIGMRMRQRWRSLLPYTLDFELEIDRCDRLALLHGRTTGDVAGTATWTFEHRDGTTTVRFLLDVRTTHWWMNIPVPFAERVFAANFDAVMRWGAEGLARLLETQVADTTAEARQHLRAVDRPTGEPLAAREAA